MVRLKNRYLVIQINPKRRHNEDEVPLPFRLNQNTLNQSIQDKVQQLHGDFGSAAIRAGFTAKYCNEYTRIAVLRCRHRAHKLVTSVIPFITRIDTNFVNITILYVGATVKQCFNFVKIHQQKRYDELCSRLKTNEEKITFKEHLLDFEQFLNTMVKL